MRAGVKGQQLGGDAGWGLHDCSYDLLYLDCAVLRLPADLRLAWTLVTSEDSNSLRSVQELRRRPAGAAGWLGVRNRLPLVRDLP